MSAISSTMNPTAIKESDMPEADPKKAPIERPADTVIEEGKTVGVQRGTTMDTYVTDERQH